MTIELGSKVKDKVTGYEGVATARTEWITGCVRYAVLPSTLTKDGATRTEEWFDEDRLEVTAKPTAKLRSVRRLGGPQRDPSRPSGPSR